MKIGFKPQRLIQNLVFEEFSNKGNTLRRVIETPKKIIDLTYKKIDFVPTQWYVANYNVMQRGSNGRIIKTFNTNKFSAKEFQSVVKKIYPQGIVETKINVDNGRVTQKTFSKLY